MSIQLAPQTHSRMTGYSWVHALAHAHTEREIVAVARDFIAHFDYHELDHLPEVCRPPKFMTGGDVAAYAFELKRHICGEDPEIAGVVRQLSDFFAEAANRVAQITAVNR